MKNQAKNLSGVVIAPVVTAAVAFAATAAISLFPNQMGQKQVLADGEIPVTAEFFPDEAFRNFVKSKIDVNPSDGKLSAEEIAATKTVNCKDMNIKDLTGIEYFTSLQYINCSCNELTTLDLSRCPDLVYLYCFENQLESIKLNENVNLQQVYCQDNKLTSLDLKGSTKLTELHCNNNELTSLEVSRCPNLLDLNLSGNLVRDLYLTRNTKLTSLSLADNLVILLDLSDNMSLTYLNCSYNRLVSLDVSGHTALKKLYCQLNSLTKLSLSSCTNLTEVDCSSNYLTSEPSVPSGCTIRYSPQSASYSGYIPVTKTYFPDANFRAYVLEHFDVNPHDEYLSPDEISDVKMVNCPKMGIRSLEGMQWFTEVKSLYCSGNLLKSFDLSKNTKLVTIDATDNLLTKVNFGYLPNLEYLRVSENEMLEEFDVSKNTKLRVLQMGSHPRLHEVDLTNNTELQDLTIYSVNLYSLNLENCEKLEVLQCVYCGLTNLRTSNNPELRQVYCYSNRLSSLDTQLNPKIELIDCHDNVMTALLLYNASNLKKLYCNDNLLSRLDLSPCPNIEYVNCQNNLLTAKPTVPTGCTLAYDDQKTNNIPIDKEHFPDQAFRDYVSSKWDKSPCDGVLSWDERYAVTEMFVQSRGIESLYGIEYFPNLQLLSCGHNKIYILDMSDNKKLRELYCQSNNIQNLYLGHNNTGLEELDCTDNALTQLSISEHTKLRGLSCGENKIKSLSVREFPLLEELDCHGNALKELDVSKNAYLSKLDCSGNALTRLDASKNTALLTLNCGSSYIDYLDVSSNKKLQYLYFSETGISKIDLSNNPNLNILECRNTKLKYIDVRNNLSLGTLDVAYNKGLTTIDVSKNTQLIRLDCSCCRLSGLDLSKNTYLYGLNCDDNLMVNLDLSKCTQLASVSCKNNYIQEKPKVPSGCMLEFDPQKKGPEVTGLKVNAYGGTSLGLIWDKSESADGFEVAGYEIQRRTSYNSDYETITTTSDNQYTDTGLKSYTVYYYRIRAYIIVSDVIVYGDYAEFSARTMEQTPTPTNTPKPSQTPTKTPTKKTSPTPTKKSTPTPVVKPGKPTNVKAVSVSATSVNVSWSAVSGAAGYQVWRSTQKDSGFVALGSVTTTSRVSTGLTTGTTYYYKVRAYKETNGTKLYGDYSAVVSCVPKPAVPGNVKATVVSLTKVRVAWSAVTGATGYEVYRSTSPDGTFSKLGSVTTTSRDCPGLTTGTTYYFKVRAYKEVNGTKVYSNYSAVVSCVPKPTAPTNVKAVVASATKVTVSWNAVTGATGYEVYRATSAGGTYSKLGTVTTTSRDCPGLTTGTTYYFKVRAYVEINGTKYYSNYSTVVNATPKK